MPDPGTPRSRALRVRAAIALIAGVLAVIVGFNGLVSDSGTTSGNVGLLVFGLACVLVGTILAFHAGRR